MITLLLMVIAVVFGLAKTFVQFFGIFLFIPKGYIDSLFDKTIKYIAKE